MDEYIVSDDDLHDVVVPQIPTSPMMSTSDIKNLTAFFIVSRFIYAVLKVFL